MALSEKKHTARKLRQKGYLIKDIAKTLLVSKSTASVWCRDIVLTERQIEKIMKKNKDALLRGRMLGAAMNRQKRVDTIAKAHDTASSMIKSISERDVMLIAAALYWAEGAKSDHCTGFQFINSDPDMIMIMKTFLLGMGYKNEDLACSIQINEIHAPRIETVLNFWKNLLEFNDEQIGNPYFIKTKARKFYENHDVHYGTCRLIVRKSTVLKYTMLALIKALKNDIVMPV